MRLWTLGIVATGCIGGTDPNEPERTCDDVETEYQAELEDIQSCTADADCGQPLQGTSCGCTRDLVARSDADLTDFEALQAEGQDMSCEIGGDSPCDCPEAAGFTCDEGTCAWNYVANYPHLPQCTADAGDPYTIADVELVDDELVVDVTYSGGCETHAFTLCWPDQSFMESYPVQVSLELFHEDPGDKCDAKPTETLNLDISPLKAAFEEAYQSKSGEITVNFGGESLSYSF